MKFKQIFMPKNKMAAKRKQETYDLIMNKYFNIFMNKYHITNVDDEQEYFCLLQWWNVGTFATFKLALENENHPQGVLVMTPYAPSFWNIYNFPIRCTLINTRGVKFIPTGEMKVNEDVVLSWCQRNHKGIKYLVDYYANKIALVDAVIFMNLQASKTPWLLGVTPESKSKMETYMKSLFDDEAYLYIDLEDVDKIKPLVTGSNFIIDKLQDYKDRLENELREILGLNNLGVAEKKEHLITGEIDVNNQTTKENVDNVLDVMKEWTDRVKEVLGVDISVELRHKDDFNNQNKPEKEVEDDDA